ncbi:MAG: hypothetical protein U9N12_03175, partial [Euryarchaeota archaeon]|nr:hypothetical protein [Euryarchaeota archaeon]
SQIFTTSPDEWHVILVLVLCRLRKNEIRQADRSLELFFRNYNCMTMNPPRFITGTINTTVGWSAVCPRVPPNMRLIATATSPVASIIPGSH